MADRSGLIAVLLVFLALCGCISADLISSRPTRSCRPFLFSASQSP